MVTGLLNNNKSQTRPELLCMCVFGGGGGVAGIYMFIRSFAFVSHWMGISNNYKYNTVL